MNPELSLDSLRSDIARARAYEAIADLKTFHTCECEGMCVCPLKWSRLFNEIYDEQLLSLYPEPSLQFTRATDDKMRQRRIVERTNIFGLECPICYEPLELGRFCTKVIACEHRFHVKCAKLWFRNKDSNTCCPMCRHQVIC